VSQPLNPENVQRLHIIYDSPRDRPGHVVVRACDVRPDGSSAFDAGAICWPYKDGRRDDPLARARRHCERLGLYRLDRHPSDDPVIVETWI
jgi:hypothetical protein